MDAYIAPPDTASEAAFYSCIKGASEYYKVPSMALLSIYAQERGSSQQTARNQNRSQDYGRFQINDASWKQYLAEHHIRLNQVLTDNCLNAYVGANIFKQRYVVCKSDVWCAIGLYHSANEPHRSNYVENVYSKYRSLQKDTKFLNWFRSLALYDASTGNWEYFRGGAVHAATTSR
ncbi:lytic transglycosylase domain-containing protein [Undibacterium sp. TS12]|uniref:lytic transglycosylase domain-containing protein n=1 Tax=Undibacterium sp. TS12 TaxID=2908202 RepID=UPI001F4CCC32|nr:lytic transglycosylase domain-containing protein [Undibacterium sp. TS12]MCH8621296.1 lytic transglycosylase domain-containing protein [Undibacterium sp. TS12]